MATAPGRTVHESRAPDADLPAFFQSPYEAAADTANWDRAALEWAGPVRG